MKKYIKKQMTGSLILILGIGCMIYGIHRQEHQTVEHKSNIICLECIGIG